MAKQSKKSTGGSSRGRQAQGKSRGGRKQSAQGGGEHGRSGKVTTDHEEIRRWVEARGGVPSSVPGTGGDDEAGILRIDFPGQGAELEPIDWDQFFEKFEEKNLAFLYQDEGDSRFNKFISRDSAGDRDSG